MSDTRYIVAEALERELAQAKATLAANPTAPAYTTRHERYVVKNWPKRIAASRRNADLNAELAKSWEVKP